MTFEKLSQAARVESDKKEAVARAAEEERRKVAADVEKTRQVKFLENSEFLIKSASLVLYSLQESGGGSRRRGCWIVSPHSQLD